MNAIRDWLIANRTPLSAKKILTQFSACCNWAVKSQLIQDNPFEDMATDIKVPKGDREETDINPFSLEERDRIILAFKESRYYKHYAPFIEFLFITGCRPSKAMDLANLVKLPYRQIEQLAKLLTDEVDFDFDTLVATQKLSSLLKTCPHQLDLTRLLEPQFARLLIDTANAIPTAAKTIIHPASIQSSQ